jgi:hypothetical protein
MNWNLALPALKYRNAGNAKLNPLQFQEKNGDVKNGDVKNGDVKNGDGGKARRQRRRGRHSAARRRALAAASTSHYRRAAGRGLPAPPFLTDALRIWASAPRLALEHVFAYIANMTSVEIIEEIKRLPREEQNRVIDFVRKAGEVRRLTPEELGELAKEMVEAKDPAEAGHLQAEIVRGFYGGQADA